jgi:hypothetical protein
MLGTVEITTICFFMRFVATFPLVTASFSLGLLPPETREGFYQETTHLIEQESPGLKFGKDLMIRVKVNELVKRRCLP